MKINSLKIFCISLSIIFSYLNVAAASQRNKHQVENYSIEKTSKDYETFKSYFPNLILEKRQIESGKKLPKTNFTSHFFESNFTQEDLAAGAKEELRAIGKILNYRGFDVFLVDYDFQRPDEDSYDNHVYGAQYLMLFKDGKPYNISVRGENTTSILLNSNYEGEGGMSEYCSFFDKDTSIMSYRYDSQSESATGLNTPIILSQKYRWDIDFSGNPRLLEIIQLQFSSPFYDKAFLQENRKLWAEYPYRNYPPKEEKWSLLQFETPLYFGDELLGKEVQLYFYIENINNSFKTVFETRNPNDGLIDSYTVGMSSHLSVENSGVAVKNKTLKCPIILKTSDGDIELLQDGRFQRKNKK